MWCLPPFVSETSCLGRVWEHLGVELYLPRTTVLLAGQTNFTQGYYLVGSWLFVLEKYDAIMDRY